MSIPRFCETVSRYPVIFPSGARLKELVHGKKDDLRAAMMARWNKQRSQAS